MADLFRVVQAQSFSLAGAGAVAGATTVTLKSFARIDGTLLTMSDFGTTGYATIEPGNGTLEEQVIFTGVTQNTNGTATLTGISTVLDVYPYTATSGLAQTHAGSTTFVLTNTARFYNQFVAKDDDGTISEVLTFTVPNYPKVNDSTTLPTDQAQFATKAYVDSVAISGAPNATTSVKGIVQIPTQAQVDAKTATGSTGASLTITPANQRSTLESDYVADTGAADAYVITPSPAISAYTTGQIFSFKATNANTTTSTLNVNALGAKTIKRIDGATNLQAGDIAAGQIITVEYDGTNMQMQSPAVNVQVPPFSSSNVNMFTTTTNGTSLAWGRPFDYQLFTATGTWTKPTNLSGNELVFVEAWGAGGGGGNAGTGGTNGAGGGGGGAFLSGYFRASDLGSTVSVTVGTGAVATIGGNTSFGSLMTAYGGGAGQSESGATNNSPGGGGGGVLGAGTSGNSDTTGGVGGLPGTNTTGVTNTGFGGGGGGTAGGGAAVYGGGGGSGFNGVGNIGGNSVYGGGGGSGGGSAVVGGTSVFGGGGGAAAVNANGTAGTAPGGGGGGAGWTGSTAKTGGAGARGEIRVWVML